MRPFPPDSPPVPCTNGQKFLVGMEELNCRINQANELAHEIKVKMMGNKPEPRGNTEPAEGPNAASSLQLMKETMATTLKSLQDLNEFLG